MPYPPPDPPRHGTQDVPPDFKREAVRLVTESGNLSRTAHDLDIRPEMLRKWRETLSAHREQAFPGHGDPGDADLARLHRENSRFRGAARAPRQKAVDIISSRPPSSSAARLHASDSTARHALTVVYEKLGVSNARAAVAWAWKHKLAGDSTR